ncbi:hypothetical protein [Shewanella xiamenensis]|uniref:hypothetical protein n=1 Tax=Shewanella xiamenensis TaxID=332186 RepID=UPI00313AC039
MPISSIDRYFSCGVYHPYKIQGVHNPRRDALTFKMMDFKNPDCSNHNAAVKEFTEMWTAVLKSINLNGSPLVKRPFNLAIVPKHEKDKVSSGLISVAAGAAARIGYTPLPPLILLRRTYTVPSSHMNTGERLVMTHVNSIEVVKKNLVLNLPTVLLDDVKTTGVSMSACKFLLEQAGSGIVIPMPILETA